MIIYLIGFLAAYYFVRYVYIVTSSDERTWNDVGATFVIALFSWLGFIVILLLFIGDKFKNTKPPKFL